MSSPRPACRFGPFTVDPASYRLLKGDAPIPVSPKALDLLFLFVDQPGALVTKDDILKVLWPDVAVTDNALTQVVSELRQALGDSPGTPTFIETVPRRGYRFVGTVQAAEIDPEPAEGGRRSLSRSNLRPPSPRTIAVMDFTNVSGDADVAWLAAGIAETVTNDLRAIRDLRVLDRTLVAEAAKRLSAGAAVSTDGVDLVVIGSYQRAGDQLRISASAVDVRTRSSLAQAKADGLLTDVFHLQDAVVTQLSAGLQLTVTPAAAARIRAHETSNLDAYRALTEGRLKLETLDPGEVPQAIADFERALSLDPGYALAHVGVAHARFWLFQASRAKNRPEVAELTSAIAHARRAIELDNDLAEAHSALAFFLVSADRTIEAIAAGRRALALEPGNWRHQFRLGVASWGSERLTCLDAVVAQFPQMAYAYFGLAMVHVARGDLRLAADVLTRGLAFERDDAASLERFPGRGLHWLLGLVRLAGGDRAEARSEFERELSSKRRAIFAEEFAMDAYDGHGFALLEDGDAKGAASMFGKALERFPDHARSLLGQVMALRQQGHKRQAEPVMRRAERALAELREHGRHTEAAMGTAFWHLLASRPADAIAALNDLFAQTPSGYAGWTIPIEPFLAPLRAEPGFKSILKRLSERAK